jgi:hypothetical protein
VRGAFALRTYMYVPWALALRSSARLAWEVIKHPCLIPL